MPAAARTSPNVMRGLEYAREVVSEKIPSCRWVRLACERQLEDLKRFKGKESPYYWDEAAAERVCTILQKFPHIRGIWARYQKKLELEPWQCFVTSCVFGWKCTSTETRRFRVCYTEVPRKNGKALALDTPIPTPGGWTTIGAIQEGDFVFDADGNPVRVLATSEIFTDHDCYSLNFSNGEAIVADAGHLWRTVAHVDQPGRRSRAGYKHGTSVVERERTTEELFQTQIYGVRNDRNHSIDVNKPLVLPEAALDIDPYMLGVWLGDGTSENAQVTCGASDCDDMVALIRDCGYAVSIHSRANGSFCLQIRAIELDLFGDRVSGRRSAQNFKHRLRRLGLLGNKHIPPVYLRASLHQRLALLQGLMDTDGTISRSGRCSSFSNTNLRLIKDVQELMSSLGIKHRTRAAPLVCNGRPVPGVGYNIQFHCFRDEMPVFRLPRKLGRMRLRTECSMQPRSQSVQIAGIEKRRPVPVKCLVVDSPTHTFLCGRSMLPTHNSSWTSALGLYLAFCDGEAGAHVVSAANTRDQAKLVFTDAQLMARRESGFRAHFGVEVMAHRIVQTETASRFEALSAEHSNLDGLNLHAALIDELHAHPTRGLWDVLETATGSRMQPLIWAITTAGLNRASVCYDQRSHVIDILEKRVEDDAYFGIIYSIDKDDDPWDEDVWTKANPNWAISVNPEGLRTEGKRAQQMPSAQAAFLTKHLNVWVNAAMAWLPAGAWDRCGDPELDIEDFAGKTCYVGIDLALRSDIAAMVIAFPPEDGRPWWAVFGRYYLPEETVNRSENNHYQGWEIAGRLIATPGAITDFDYIIANLGDACRQHEVKEIILDPYDAGPLIVDIEKAGLPQPVEVRQIAPNLSPAMMELEGLVLSRKIRHDGDPVLAWMFSNVKIARSGDLIKPVKESDEKKIDGVVSLLMCIHRAMKSEPQADYSGGVWVI